VIFFPFMVVTGITVSGYSFNQLLLSLIGYFLPLICIALYYFWIDALPEFIIEYILATRIVDVYTHVRYLDLGILVLPPIIFAAIGYFVSTIFKHITVNQQKQRQIVIIFLIFALLSLFLTNRKTPYQLVILIPGLTYFISQIFIYLNKGKLLQFLSISFLLCVPLGGYIWTFNQIQTGKIEDFAVYADQKHQITTGKSVLVMGQDLGFYNDASLATPYLNFKLSKRVLEDYKDFNDMAIAHQYFIKEKPDVIIDEEGVFERLLNRLPDLSKLYENEKEGVFIKKFQE
jgi:hypothetical protein